ncbi:defensin, isoforms B and C [Sitophilus oryzae]|uniref:Defensin, isoforms B and C n=1 Tax=Sitophilus oryzae TaxID=7048 RepID=A0A6J2YNG0_SITOR|nr:defensin, isoforms B and C [Sitophilus oryzae]
MVKLAFLVLLIVFSIGVYCAPMDEDFQDQLIEGPVRVKRATCDLLSFEIKGFKLNDSACAAHCLTLGKRGGHCNGSKVCVCRK